MDVKEKNEKRNIIIIIVVTVLLLVALTVGWYFVLVKNVTAEREAAQKDYDARKAIADRLEKSQLEQRKAEDRLVEVTGQLQFFRRLYRSLDFGAMGTDPATTDPVQRAERERTWRAWMREYFADYAAAFTSTLDAKAAQSGVALERSIKVANPPQTPEDVVAPPNGFLKPAQGSGNSSGGVMPGGVTSISAAPGLPGGGAGGGAAATSGAVALKATGTLLQLIDFFQRLNTSPILMVVQNIKLDSSSGGGSTPQNGIGGLAAPGTLSGIQTAQRQTVGGVPKVTATFNLVPYLLARGAGAPITAGGGGAGGGTTAAPAGPGLAGPTLISGPGAASPAGNGVAAP